MNTRKLLAGALSASLLMAAMPGLALAQDEATDASDLSPEGVDWLLSTIAGDAVPVGVEVTLLLSGGEIVGSAGCNSYFGSYEIDGSDISFPEPFGVTQKICEDDVQAVEDAYLPLLQGSASWSIDEVGALSLADADGVDQLVYGEPPIDITASDVNVLVAALSDLQAQIDEATAEVEALAEETASIPVNTFDKRLTATEKDVTALENKVGNVNSKNLKKRTEANEAAIAELQGKVADINKTINKLRGRIQMLEATAEDHEARIAAIEGAAPAPAE